MWRERLSPAAIWIAMAEIEATRPGRIPGRWTIIVRTWRAGLLAMEGVTEQEAEAEIGRAYAVCWTQCMALRVRMPTPLLVEAWWSSVEVRRIRARKRAAKARRALAALPAPAVRVPPVGAMGTDRRRMDRPGWR